MTRALPGIGVDHERLDRRLLRRAHVQHVGAVFGERACAGGTGEHAREIEHAHTAERPRARLRSRRARERLGIGVADSQHLDERRARERDALRMRAPFLGAAQARAAEAAFGERVLERLRVPGRDRGGDRVASVGAGEQRERSFVQSREAAVQVDPAVARAVKRRAGAGVAWKRGTRGAQQQERQQRRGSRARVDLDALRRTSARAPEVCRDGGLRAEHRGSRLADAKARREDRVGARHLQRVGGRGAPERVEEFAGPAGRRRCVHRATLSRAPPALCTLQSPPPMQRLALHPAAETLQRSPPNRRETPSPFDSRRSRVIEERHGPCSPSEACSARTRSNPSEEEMGGAR